MRPSPLLAVPLLLVATLVVDLTIADDANGNTAGATAPSPLPAANPQQPPPPAVTALPPAPPPEDDDPSAWSPVVDVEDRTIRQVGQFAVRVYCLDTPRPQLAFVNVVSGRTQPYGGGAMYQLVITVAAADGPGEAETTMVQYAVRVWGILGTTSWQLLSFEANK